MRIAYVSPLPPARTGIADYSAELLPHLAEALGSGGEVELFVDDAGDAPPVDAALRGRFALHPWTDLAERHRLRPYDAVLYQVGNSADFHAFVVEALREVPGVVVLHEPMLHHLVRGMTLSRGDVDGYLAALHYAAGEAGEFAGRRFVEHDEPLDIWAYPLFEEVVDRSLGLIVHNRYTRDRVLARRPEAAIRVVPHHLSLAALGEAPPAELAALRSRFGIDAEALVVGTYGLITPVKRLEVVLRAFARLRSSRPDAMLLLAGDVSPYYDLEAVLAEHGADGVLQVGHLGLAEFLRAMELCDVAVNLRHPTAGETSGTLIRLLGLGKPVLVTDAGSFAEIPDDCCCKVPLDEREEDTVAGALAALAADPSRRRRLGAAARAHLRQHHTLEGSARAYREVLAASSSSPRPGLLPSALLGRRGARARTVASVAGDLFDLGVADRDEELLAGVAGLLAEVGVASGGGGRA